MEKAKAVWSEIADSLWFLPSILTLAGGVLALLAVNFNDTLLDMAGVEAGDLWWLFGGGSDAARSILDAITGSLITVTGVVFSVTIIALQLASSQFTPRVLRTFTADRGNQLVLGVFIGTFTYALLVQRAVRASNDEADAFVPAIAITGAILLTLVAIGFLIYYIDHAARSMQASVIIDNVTLETRAVGDRIFSREDAAAESAGDAPANGGIVEQVDERAAPAAIGQNTAGYVQSINEGRLFELAADEGLLLRVDAAIGDFVLPRQPLVSVWPANRVDDELRRTLRRAFALGLERTPHQDFEFGLVELVDIGVKALSPSINDPTTAMNTIDRIAELLVLLGRRGAPDCDRRDRHGRVCLIVRRPTFDRAVTLTFDQIRHHGAADPALMGKLIDSLGALAELVRAEHRPRLETAISTARAHAAREIDEPTDRERVDRAAAEALRRLRAAPAA